MTTSQPNTFLSEIVSGGPIPPETLGYFRGRLSNRFHELVLDLFVELERAGKITRAALARRIGKAPEQVTRWLGAPGNWTSDTISDLLLGMGYEPALSVVDLSAQIAEARSCTWDDLPDEHELIVDPIPEPELAVADVWSNIFAQRQQSVLNWNNCLNQVAPDSVQTGSFANMFFASSQHSAATGWLKHEYLARCAAINVGPYYVIYHPIQEAENIDEMPNFGSLLTTPSTNFQKLLGPPMNPAMRQLQ